MARKLLYEELELKIKELEEELFREQQKLESQLKAIRMEFIEKEKSEIKHTETAALKEVESIKNENNTEISKIIAKKDKEKSKLVDKIIENLLNG